MNLTVLTEDDRGQLDAVGITEAEAIRQIELFENPPPFASLDRPCTRSDGIRVLSESDVEEALAAYERARLGNRFSKFVPASGAATRMFQALLWFVNEEAQFDRDEIDERAKKGDGHFPELARFLDGLGRFAFADELAERAGGSAAEAVSLAAAGRYKPLLEALLRPDGLGFAALPKGLIPFHRYEDGSRTPFEEHLVEAALYAANADKTCTIHFTISPEHEARFRQLLDDRAPVLTERYGVRFDVTFSTQHSSTDTLAVDLDNQIFRDAEGRILLRPGGHGALIRNLNDHPGDMVFIKNIDNVTPRQLRPEVCGWKKALAGLAAQTQEKIAGHLNRLESSDDDGQLADALAFAADMLSVVPPDTAPFASPSSKRAYLVEKLQRPLRVCGMVPNVGDPGGGPFWVRGEDNALSLQIVESAQVDMDDDDQIAILGASTHFNPVDILCVMRDHRGEPFDLLRHIDRNAVFISRKSKDGRELKALERPGLWNGAMADWNTIFVEMPGETFSPVKRVTDLLKADHQET